MSIEFEPAYNACRAWVYNEAVSGEKRRKCVLLSGHYVEGAVGSVDDPRRSWHTDCPNMTAKQNPDTDQQHTHKHAGVSCSVWSDWAAGAHADRDDRVISPEDPEAPATPLTDDVIPAYTANVQLGTTGLTVHGPARFVATVVRAFADAFEEESER
jgi:hypothetical protein